MDSVDAEAEQLKLENELTALRAVWDSEPMKIVRTELEEQEERFVKLICGQTITDLKSFFAHFEAVGHLRGLRQTKSIFESALEQMEERIKQTK